MKIKYSDQLSVLSTQINKYLLYYDKIFIITQKNIIGCNDVLNPIINNSTILLFPCKESESCKSIKEVDRLLNFLLNNKCNKQSLILGIGGGTVTDLAGFIASIYNERVLIMC